MFFLERNTQDRNTSMVSNFQPLVQEQKVFVPHPWLWAIHFFGGIAVFLGVLFYTVKKQNRHVSDHHIQAVIAPFQEKIEALEFALAKKTEEKDFMSEDFSCWTKLFEEMKPQKMLQALHKMPAEKAIRILQALKPHVYKKVVSLLPAETLSRWMSSLDKKNLVASKEGLVKTMKPID